MVRAMTVLRSAWKAIAAFFTVFLGQLVENFISSDGSVVLPQTQAEWVSAISVALVGSVVVYVLPNRYTKPQVEKQIDRLPEDDQKAIMASKNVQHPNWT